MSVQPLIDDFDIDEDSEEVENLYLTFTLAEQDYGIGIKFVREIVGIQKITELPDTPDFLKGVINLRGEVIPVVDVRKRFYMDDRGYDERTCVIVIEDENTSAGLIVDAVSDVKEITPDNIFPPPNITKTPGKNETAGIGRVEEEVVVLLKVSAILNEEWANKEYK